MTQTAILLSGVMERSMTNISPSLILASIIDEPLLSHKKWKMDCSQEPDLGPISRPNSRLLGGKPLKHGLQNRVFRRM